MKQKCSLKLYRNFLIANHNRYSGNELAQVSPDESMAHDSVNRWLLRTDFTPSELWRQVKPLVRPTEGYLVGDDTLLEKPYSRQNELAKVQYSGVRHGQLNGINLVNLLWTSGIEYIPVDYRIYYKQNDDKTKNDHYLEMLNRAEQRGFRPQYVLNDSWYGSVANMKAIDHKGWKWITNLRSNRQVAPLGAKGAYVPVADLDLIDKQVKPVWLKEYGTVLVCQTVDTKGDVTYLATNDLELIDYGTFLGHWDRRWKIEELHRGLKQTTGIAKCYSTKAGEQRTHIFAAFSAFIQLEKQRLRTGVAWYEQKAQITRQATGAYLRSA